MNMRIPIISIFVILIFNVIPACVSDEEFLTSEIENKSTKIDTPDFIEVSNLSLKYPMKLFIDTISLNVSEKYVVDSLMSMIQTYTGDGYNPLFKELLDPIS